MRYDGSWAVVLTSGIKVLLALRVMQWIHYHLSATATVMQVHGSIFHCHRLMWKLQCLLYLILSI